MKPESECSAQLAGLFSLYCTHSVILDTARSLVLRAGVQNLSFRRAGIASLPESPPPVPWGEQGGFCSYPVLTVGASQHTG